MSVEDDLGSSWWEILDRFDGHNLTAFSGRPQRPVVTAG